MLQGGSFIHLRNWERGRKKSDISCSSTLSFATWNWRKIIFTLFPIRFTIVYHVILENIFSFRERYTKVRITDIPFIQHQQEENCKKTKEKKHWCVISYLRVIRSVRIIGWKGYLSQGSLGLLEFRRFTTRENIS